MTYFKIEFKPEALGSVPQDEGIIGRYNVNAANSFRNFKFDDQIEELWVPEGIKFRYHAKFTDILLFALIGHPYLILSEAFLKVVSSLRVPEHQVFPLKVIKQKKEVQYYIFISKVYFAEYIDYEGSNFYIGTFDRSPIRTPVKIQDTIKFWKMYHEMEEGAHIGASSLKLNNALIEYDLFRLPRGIFEPYYLVSETFVEAVNKAGLTGIRFTPFDGVS